MLWHLQSLGTSAWNTKIKLRKWSRIRLDENKPNEPKKEKKDEFLNHYEIPDTCLPILWKLFVTSVHPSLTKQIAPFHGLTTEWLVKYFNVQ